MSDSDLFDAVAQKTGEDSHEIRRRGLHGGGEINAAIRTAPSQMASGPAMTRRGAAAYSRVWRAYLDIIREAA